MKRISKTIFALSLVFAMAILVSAGAIQDGGMLYELESIKTQHVCSIDHEDCAAYAKKYNIENTRAGGAVHCPFGNLITSTKTGAWYHTSMNCTHGAVGRVDYDNYRDIQTTYTCTGCAFTHTSTKTEGPIRSCGAPMK